MNCPLCDNQLIPSLFPNWLICSTQHYMIVYSDDELVYENAAFNEEYFIVYSKTKSSNYILYKKNNIKIMEIPLTVKINKELLPKLLKLAAFS